MIGVPPRDIVDMVTCDSSVSLGPSVPIDDTNLLDTDRFEAAGFAGANSLMCVKSTSQLREGGGRGTVSITWQCQCAPK